MSLSRTCSASTVLLSKNNSKTKELGFITLTDFETAHLDVTDCLDDASSLPKRPHISLHSLAMPCIRDASAQPGRRFSLLVGPHARR